MYLSDPANAGHKNKCWWSPNGRITFCCCTGAKWSLPPCTATPASKEMRDKDRGTGSGSEVWGTKKLSRAFWVILFLKVCCWGSIVQLCPTCKFSYGKVTVGSFTCSMSPASIVLPVLQGQLRSLAGNLAPERNSSGKQPFQKHIIKPSDQ